MNKYYISYTKNDVSQGIIVEASSEEVAGKYLGKYEPGSHILGIKQATADHMKPGMPVVKAKEMTHNEYQQYLKDNAARFHSEIGYTMDDFKRDADSVVITGFKLDKFNLSDETKQLINVAFNSDEVKKNGNLLLRGRFEYPYALADKLGCSCMCDGAYNGFFKNDKSKLVLEFCEGDVYLILCETDEAYRKELASYNKFYKLEAEFACLKVFFDGVHVDSVYIPENEIDSTINSIVREGYDNYNGAVKEDWMQMKEFNPKPKMSFEVEKYLDRTVDEVLADAKDKSSQQETEGEKADKDIDLG